LSTRIIIARRLIKLDGIKSARYISILWHATAVQVSSFCQRAATEFGWPLFVKPLSTGSSVGVHKASNMAELMNAVADARRYDQEILIEECIKGREIELAVLENSSATGAPKVSMPGEIRVNHADGFYSYAAKYLESEATELITPAVLEDNLVRRLQQVAAEIFTSLKCKGMARVDFFVNDETGQIYFNEINTLPGFTPISMYPRMWEASGLPYPQLLDCLIKLAMAHHHCRQQLVRHYQ
jgi:D-alanine-D-alanine ligase